MEHRAQIVFAGSTDGGQAEQFCENWLGSSQKSLFAGLARQEELQQGQA